MADLLSDNGILTIAVVGENENQTAQILSSVQSCTAGEKNAYCYSAAPEEVEEAHKLGLSYGKYRAFLELQELDPSITAEEIQNMSMREIRNMIQSLTDGDGASADRTETGSGYGRGHGNGQGRRGNLLTKSFKNVDREGLSLHCLLLF